MKTYSIGEALCNFKLDTLAYIFKGNAEGSLMWADLNNENRIIVAYPDGTLNYGIYVSIKDVPKEEGQCIVFVEEMKQDIGLARDIEEEELFKNTYNGMAQAIHRVATDFRNAIEELPPEEKAEMYARLEAEREQYIQIKMERLSNEEN